MTMTNDNPGLSTVTTSTRPDDTANPACRDVLLKCVRPRSKPVWVVEIRDGSRRDELFREQDTVLSMGAEKAWARIEPGRTNNIVTAIIDNGVDLDHPDLVGQLVSGKDFPCRTQACKGGEPTGIHGTAMAGIVAAGRGNGGIVGVAWNTRVMSLRISANDEDAAELAAVNAIEHALKHGAKVLNFSYASNEPTEQIRKALLNAPQDFLLIVPAGNDGMESGGKIYPAAYAMDRMIVVTSHDAAGKPAGAIGGGVKVDIAAPGEAVYPIPCNPVTKNICYGSTSSTSNATAYVSGAAALLWSLHPKWTAAQIKKRILGRAAKEPKLDRVMKVGRRLDLNRMTQH